jgi:LysR family hydrogen peroxide-inducible transcriptional activator
MELQQLRYFLAVVKTGNFSRAAEKCHVAQPSLSQQILKLEAELGEKLLERLKGRATPTPAGEILLDRAERILQEVEEASRQVRDVRGLVRGKVSLGALPTIAPYLLPRLIQTFGGKHPDIQMVVHEETTSRLVQLVEAGELDLALVSSPAAGARLEKEELFSEELLLALPPKHRLAHKPSIRLSDIEHEKFILMKEGHCLGAQALLFCHSHDFHPQVACRSAQVETIQALVMAGLGISLVPQMALNASSSPRPVYRPLAAPAPRRSIVLIWRKHRQLSLAATELRRQLQDHARGTPASRPACPL